MKRFIKTLEPLSGLPNGFTEVEYLESTTGQYIDTGVGVKSNTVAKAVFSITSNVQGKSYFGARNSTNERFQIVNSFGVGAGYFYNNNIYPVVNKQFEIEMRASGEVYLDGIKRDATNGTFSAVAFDRTLYIFHTNYYDGSGTPTASKFWKVQILEGDTLVRDYIPALDPSGRPCMYDLVEGKPYYNQATSGDEFTYGKQIIPVEYLESTGTQYIDTGVYGNLETKIEAKVYSAKIDSISGYCIAGDFTTSTKAITMPINFTNAGLYSRFGDKAITSGIQQQDGTYTIAVDKVGYYVDETKIADLNTTTAFTTSGTMMLFGFTGLGRNYLVGKMYYCKIWNNNALVRDYIPVKDENDIGYMFDRVSHSLYVNAGTGSFSYGTKVYKPKLRLVEEKSSMRGLPNGFTEVEYLEATGTQYIDTGVMGNGEFNIKYGLYVNSLSSSSDIFAGARSSNQHLNFGQAASNGQFTIGYLNQYWQELQNFATNTHYDIEISYKSGEQYIIINGTKSSSKTYTGTEQTDLTIYLFKRHHYGTDNVGGLQGRIYYFTIKQNDVLVRDFIPCLDYNNVPCMYDKVEGKPYYNQGTGEFGYGKQIIPVEYLESTGTQYIDTGYAFTDGFSWEIDFDGIIKGTTLFGGRTSSTRTAILYQKSATQGIETTCPIAGMTGDQTPFQLADISTGKHKVKMSVASNKGSVWVDNTQVYNEQSFTGTYISGTTQVLFADNFGTSVSEYTSSKVYALKMWQGSNIIRDFIPAIDENDVGYMFDKVTHSLYENNGTGTFNYGTKVYKRRLRLASEPWYKKKYDLLTYLESTGTQYIDTDYKPNQNTKVECKLYNPTNFNTSKPGSILFGSRNSGNMPTFTVIGNILNKYGTRWDYGNGIIEKVEYPLTVGEHTIVKNKQYNYLDGVLVATNVESSFNMDYTMHIFGTNTAGTNTLSFVGRFYYFKIWDNNVLIRDFRPAKRKSDNKYGMLDMVTKQFYTNAGTGDFTGE